MKFSIAINMTLTNYPIEDRIKIAAECGYDGVDVYMDHDSYDPEKLRKTAEECGIPIVSSGVNNCFCNTFDKSWSELKPVWQEAFTFAKACGSSAIAGLGGFKTGDFYDPKCLIIENVRRLSELAREYGITVMVEPINNVLEHRTAYLHTSAMGLEIVKTVDSPYVKLLYDFIHMESSEGNVLLNSTQNTDLIQMFHVVGIPRHDEPFHSPLDYPYLLQKIEEAGYDGFVCAEYAASYDPVRSARDVLAYLRSYRERNGKYETR
ncbi:MAG: TIM barrel protein [Oscillospiraceae bacterium]